MFKNSLISIFVGCWCAFGITSALSRISLPSLPTMPLFSASIKEQQYQPSVAFSQDIVSKISFLENKLSKNSKIVEDVMRYLENDKEKWKKFDGLIQDLDAKLDNMNSRFDSSKISSCDDDTIDEKVRVAFLTYFRDNVSKEDLIQIFNKISIIAEENKKVDSPTSVEQTQGCEDIDERIERVVAERFKLYAADRPEKVDYALGAADDSIDERIRRVVAERLKLYDADKTGKVDYALEPAGGQVISTRCTQLYNIRTRAFKILGITLFYESNNPRSVIQGHVVQPGICWAFQGFPGYLLIKLRTPIQVTGFTLEHAPKVNLPNEDMNSALRTFEVWGFKEENDKSPVLYGEYEFLDDGNNLQYFPVQNTTITEPYEYIELRILSNHGREEYTCLYRFRVHGRAA